MAFEWLAVINLKTSHGRQFTLKLVRGGDQLLCVIAGTSSKTTKYIKDQNKY